MITEGAPRLHWTQRIALVRHNLHAARRTNDFSFFKSLQAHALIDGTDHAAILYNTLGDTADSVLSTLDNLNAGIAYVHQDAFKTIYDNAKANLPQTDRSLSDRKSLLRVDICQQSDMADHAIDKTTNSVTNLIQAQPTHSQDAIANAWITGTTIIADAVCVCLNEMKTLDTSIDDFIRLEYSWSRIQSSVDSSISALRGIFSLMATPYANPASLYAPNGRNLSVASSISDNGASSSRSRTSSSASAFSLIKRAFGQATSGTSSIAGPNSTPATSLSRSTRSGSISYGNMVPPEASTRTFRASMSAACPTKIPVSASGFTEYPHTVLTTIPPTPAVVDVGTPTAERARDDPLSPFKQGRDYFVFDVDSHSKDGKEMEDGASSVDDLMQIESLDPLYAPEAGEGGRGGELRVGSPAAIAV